MKKVFFAIVLLTGIAFSSTSCKGDKKADKATETTKEVVKEVETKTETAKEITKELSAQAKEGLALINGKGACIACHKDHDKLVGPSYAEVAKIYKEKNGNLVKFLKGEAEAIVDPAQFALMAPNLEITKKMSGDELAAIAAYIRTLE